VPDAVHGEPAWHPDPSGRHQLRWWDGTNFTDQVADGGVVGTDHGPVAPAAVAPAAVPPAPAAAAPARGRPGLLLGLVAIGVLAVGAAGWYVLLRDDSAGTGTFEGQAAPDGIGTHEVAVGAGTALAIRVEPGSDLDAVVAIVVGDDDAERLEDLYGDLGLVEARELDDAFSAVDGDQLDRFGDAKAVLRTDVGFAGEDEEVLLAVPFALDVEVVVAPFADDDDDSYTITIESFGIDTDDTDDGEDVLDAVVDSDDVPSRVRRVAEDLLELVE
jgi:hypothetical protein